jgi:hypothetical protein
MTWICKDCGKLNRNFECDFCSLSPHYRRLDAKIETAIWLGFVGWLLWAVLRA